MTITSLIGTTAVCLVPVLLGSACDRAPDVSTAADPPASVAPLAIRNHEIAGIEVLLLEVRRGPGDTITVRWAYRNTTSKPRALAPGGSAPAEESRDRSTRLGETVFVVDPQNGKKYHVLRDAKDRPIASDLKPTAQLPAGQSLEAWARFPTPTGAISGLAIHISGAAPFDGISIAP